MEPITRGKSYVRVCTILHLFNFIISITQDGSVNEREILNQDDAASANQIRMNSDPFEIMLMNMGYRIPIQQAEFNDEDDEERYQPFTQALNCRPS